MKLENESALRARLLDPPKARRLSSQRRLLYARWDLLLLLLFAVRETFYSLLREKKNARGILCVRYYIHNGTRPFFTKTLRCWCSFFLFFWDFFQTCSKKNLRTKPLKD